MKLVTYHYQDRTGLGLVFQDRVFPLDTLDTGLPMRMMDLLQGGEVLMGRVRKAYRHLAAEAETVDGFWAGIPAEAGPGEALKTPFPMDDIQLLAPVPDPGSCRDAYAFRQHVETSRRNRGLGMIPEFDQFPVFYFTNHRAIYGPGDVRCMPAHFDRLDFELEVAVVLNRQGRNIPAGEADGYIAGYMIMNDLSARTLQMEEMKLSLGPAKGKDFATVLGPYLVTPDELEPYLADPMPGHTGRAHRLEMLCRVNGREVSRGLLSDMQWTFAEIIERVSYGVDVHPGDVIGSGTVGTGCFLELNGAGRLRDPENYREQWLQPGDLVEMEVTGLGLLSNRVLLGEV